MERFLTKLYSYEYFTTYLIIAIAILLVLFFVVLFFGKKDQKNREIEATKKLAKINAEESTEEQIDNNPKTEEDKLENDTIIVPNINDLNIDVKKEEEVNIIPDAVLPEEETVNNELPTIDDTPIEDAFKVEDTKENINVLDDSPILEPLKETPLVVEENVKEPSFEEISVPEFNFEEVVKNTEEIKEEEEKPKSPEIFSSVYIPEEEKKEDKEEEIELPTLKKDVEMDIPKLHDYNLDEISGESYDIK